MKVKLGFGKFRFTMLDIFTNRVKVLEARIGCGGNQVFTDEFGYRYVPYCEEEGATKADLDSLMFKECSYMVVSSEGIVYDLIMIEELD
jgi:hypothetical protein